MDYGSCLFNADLRWSVDPLLICLSSFLSILFSCLLNFLISFLWNLSMLYVGIIVDKINIHVIILFLLL